MLSSRGRTRSLPLAPATKLPVATRRAPSSFLRIHGLASKIHQGGGMLRPAERRECSGNILPEGRLLRERYCRFWRSSPQETNKRWVSVSEVRPTEPKTWDGQHFYGSAISSSMALLPLFDPAHWRHNEQFPLGERVMFKRCFFIRQTLIAFIGLAIAWRFERGRMEGIMDVVAKDIQKNFPIT